MKYTQCELTRPYGTIVAYIPSEMAVINNIITIAGTKWVVRKTYQEIEDTNDKGTDWANGTIVEDW